MTLHRLTYALCQVACLYMAETGKIPDFARRYVSFTDILTGNKTLRPKAAAVAYGLLYERPLT